MNELPRIEREDARPSAERAVAQELFGDAPPTAPPVQIALYVNGRLVNMHTDSATVLRVLSILTGLEA